VHPCAPSDQARPHRYAEYESASSARTFGVPSSCVRVPVGRSHTHETAVVIDGSFDVCQCRDAPMPSNFTGRAASRGFGHERHARRGPRRRRLNCALSYALTAPRSNNISQRQRTLIEEIDVKTRKTRSGSDVALANLYGRPAFMIRRAHQIATSIFTSSCAELGLTPSQFSLMFVLRHRGPVGQNELGRLVSLDRSTTALVVRGLKARELVETAPDASDRRKTIVRLTDKGRLLLARAEKLSTKASDKLLSAFDPDQATAFLSLLETLTSSLSDEDGRASIGTARAPERRRTRA